jgi:hypothetical protein
LTSTMGEEGSASSPLTVRTHPSTFNNSTTQRQIGLGREGLRQEKTPVSTFRPCLLGHTSKVRRSSSLSRRYAQYKTIRCEYSEMSFKPSQNSGYTSNCVTGPSTLLTVPMNANLLSRIKIRHTASYLASSRRTILELPCASSSVTLVPNWSVLLLCAHYSRTPT